MSESTSELIGLLSAEAVRSRCGVIGQAAEQGRTQWFHYCPENLSQCVDLVAAECQTNYPDLVVPFHSRWRHFNVGEVDLWQHYSRLKLNGLDRESKTRSAIDLVFISVLLDAGAGPTWRYHDPVTHEALVRSEGLAAATIDLFFNHLGRQVNDIGIVVDAEAILSCNKQVLEHAFQHRTDNELLGIEGRSQLLVRLATQLKALAKEGISRPGHILDLLLQRSDRRRVSAADLLELLLSNFNPMWPSGLILEGVHLGDCGHHTLLEKNDAGGLIPFHKLSQWLAYSLIEPLQWAGFEVTDLDQLTGLPEYRNGGLLIDMEVLVPAHKDLCSQKLTVDSEPVVEWRALTVWLLDKIADGVRAKLELTSEQLPLASVLQGGTWSAGRKLAEQTRSGAPPLNLAIDGTVF
ncbi:MAG: DUF1688 family protein [bacterium]